ncbi:non-hydrolyzing UDP-N-acetylglucosamine 2-epimerase [Corynebacterium casei]|uniref:non-hydrolyzing UDP-N-acetylglucosamine 2-epimerase n=1 Tax=Corynebacterium casei TaxID=160386 RepID=UPI003FCEF392
MAKPKVMSVYGTRPEAIKLAPVIKALEGDDRFESVAVSTGQHKEMLDQVNQMFGINPAFDLKLMKSSQSLNELVSRAITGLDAVIKQVAPDAIVVQGDTSTAMAAALAGFHLGVKVVHLEAGLRTGDIRSPFPEEANRKVISQVASLHLAPTDGAQKNLQIENVLGDDIVVTGNTVIDALLDAVQWDTKFDDDALANSMNSSRRVVVVTTHRRENHHAMHEIGSAVQTLAKLYPDVDFVLPLHLNPAVREAVLPEIESRPNVIITGPLPYDQFTKLQSRASFILTDSGGVQEEAPSLGTPVLLMRGNTERPEAIVAGTVKLVGTKERLIVAEAGLLLDDDAVFAEMANSVNPYGDGNAAIRSVAAIAELLGVGRRIAEFSPYQSK